METGEPIDPNTTYRPAEPYGPPQAYYQPQPVDPWQQPGYGYGYPQQQNRYAAPTRPGHVLGASVLAYVLGALLILAGILLIFGASLASSLGDVAGTDTGSITAELVLDGVANLVAAGLLIAGGVNLTSGRLSGRVLLGWGAALTGAASVYWLARTSGASGAVVYALAFDALAAIAVWLMAGAGVTRWLRERSAFGYR